MNYRENRIVNIVYEVDGYRFDAAVDCNWQMHAYSAFDFGQGEECDWKTMTPIELYCCDNPDWDIRMIYYRKKKSNGEWAEVNDQKVPVRYDVLNHSVVDMNFIIEETRKWIEEIKS